MASGKRLECPIWHKLRKAAGRFPCRQAEWRLPLYRPPYLCIGKSAGNVMMARIDRENPHACAQEFQKETVVMKKSRQLDETQLSGRKE